jgi:hypothetical protein
MSWRAALMVAALCGLLVDVRVSIAGPPTGAGTEELTRQRMGAARDAYQFAWDAFKPFDLSKGDGEAAYRWSRRWMEAERDLASTEAGRVAALRGHLERMRGLEDEVRGYIGSTIPLPQLAATRFYRAEAETWLAEAKAK